MKFSEYLRLNEGNYGHEFGKEAEKHEAANEANREHAAAKRDESTMAPKKPHLQVGANSQEVANRTMPPAEQAKLSGERKAWRDKLRPTGDDGGAQAARDAANTVKEPSGEVMNDPKTGKPFPKTGPLKDWQVPSLRESERPGEAINYGRDEEDEPEENTEDDGHAPKPKNTLTVAQLAAKKNLGEAIKKSGLPPLKRSPGDTVPGFLKKPEFPSIRPNESDEDTAIRDRMKSRDAREQRLKDTISKRQANESVGIPERDALGRLSIYSMQESSTNKFQRKALKRANMGKKLSNADSGRVMRNTKADPSTRTNAGENYKDPQADRDANDAAEADRRENAVGMDRQSHLDK